MKLKTAALIAIIGNSLALIFWTLQVWEIVVISEKVHAQISQTTTNTISNGTVILFLIIFFTKAK